VSYGRLFDEGGFVWGVEAELAHSSKSSFDIGPWNGGEMVATGPGTVGQIHDQQDDIAGDLQLPVVATLKANMGIKVGHAALVSVFAGPSLARAKLAATQTWNYYTLYCYTPTGNIHAVCDQKVESSRAASAVKSKTLVGATIGGETRYRMADRWMLRSRISLSRYPKIDTLLDSGGGTTRVSVKPQIVSGSLGLLYVF
jgi:hypothetical protein